MNVVTLTMNPAIDVTTRVDRVAPDRKLRCDNPEREAGGGGINVSRAIERLGGRSVALFPAGGPNGEQLGRLLRDEGVAYRAIEINGMTRANVTVTETGSDQQYRFVMPGPQLTAADGERCLAALKYLDDKPDFIVASGSLAPGIDAGFYARIVEHGEALGARVIVDTSGEALKQAVRKGAFLVKPNMRELSNLTGLESGDERDMTRVVREMMHGCSCKAVVVSLGAGGALLVTDTSTEHVRTPTVPIRSKVGAGDSMTAGIVLSLARGEELTEAVRFGVAAGAAAVLTPGTELCRRDDTERLYKQMQEQTQGA